MPGAGRCRGRYSDEFKRQVVAACNQPGVSASAVALANGLNANLLRRWISESQTRGSKPAIATVSATVRAKQAKALTVATQTPFIPVPLQSNGAAPANIQIELQVGTPLIRVQCPVAGAVQCAAWMRELLK